MLAQPESASAQAQTRTPAISAGVLCGLAAEVR
jgi:hypothetical protein